MVQLYKYSGNKYYLILKTAFYERMQYVKTMCMHQLCPQLQFIFHIVYYQSNEPLALNLTPLAPFTSLTFFKLEIFL